MKVDARWKMRCNGVQGGMPIMMGLKERTFAPLTAVSVEELVPQDHFYRHLHKVLDLSFVYNLVREHYSVAGRPSIDPIVFFKLQLVMFFEDIVRYANRLSGVGKKNTPPGQCPSLSPPPACVPGNRRVRSQEECLRGSLATKLNQAR